MNKGRLTIRRIDSNQRESFVKITLLAKFGVLPVAEIDIPMEDFAQAILGMGHTPCEFSLPRIEKQIKEGGYPQPTPAQEPQ